MGESAEELEQQPAENLEAEQKPPEGQELPPEGDEKQGDEEGPLEVILEGETPTQEQKPTGFQSSKRRNRYARRLDEKDEVITGLQNQINQLQQQSTPAPVADVPIQPSKDDYYGDDAGYNVALNQYRTDVTTWQANQTTNLVQQQQNGLQNQQRAMQSQKAINSHYDQAAKLGADDFADVESNAVDILGESVVREMIPILGDKSAAIMYYLGKNEDKAFEIKEALERNPTEATMLIGELRGRIKTRLKTKSQAPAPETQVAGKSPAGTSALQRRYDAALSEALEGKGGALNERRKIKQEAEAKGITLE